MQLLKFEFSVVPVYAPSSTLALQTQNLTSQVITSCTEMSNYTVVIIFREVNLPGTGRHYTILALDGRDKLKLESDVLVADMLCAVMEAVTEDARDSCLFSP